MLLSNSGSSTFFLFLNALDHLRHKFIIEDHQKEYHIWTMNSGTPYFENDFLLRQRSDYPGTIFVSSRSTILTGDSNLIGANISPLPSDREALNWYLHNICDSSGIHLIYLENFGNNVHVDVPNLKLLADVLGNARRRVNPGVLEIVVYIDSSTMGGIYNPLEDFEAAFQNVNCPITIIVGLSAIKFLGAGTDRANLGLLYGKGDKASSIFDFMRQASYTYGEPTLHTIASMPLVDREILEQRRKRFSFNAQFLASHLEQRLGQYLRIHYPGLSSHPQHELAKSLYGDFFGSFFFIELPDQKMYQRFMEKVRSYSDDIIADGTSYGLNTTRVEVRTEEKNGEKNPMGIRMSVGTENIKQLMLVLDRLEQITQEVLEIS
jgi:cystathionine beta-lyase/cystathionine gamma-synthase